MPVPTTKIKELRDARPKHKWKVQTAKDWGCVCVSYIDARAVMDLLDDVIGPENWQCKYQEHAGVVYCSVGIDIDGQGWIWKEDAGAESKMEAEKGQASDAFKRAAVRWGVGRFLYDMDEVKLKSVSAGGKFFPADNNGKRIYNLTAHIEAMSRERKQMPKQQTPLASAEQKATIQKLAVCLGWSADRLKKFLAKGGTDLGSINTLQADKAAQNMQKAIFQPKEFGEFATDDQKFDIDGLQKALGWDGKRLDSFLAQVNLSVEKMNKPQAEWVIWQLSKIQANQKIPA